MYVFNAPLCGPEKSSQYCREWVIELMQQSQKQQGADNGFTSQVWSWSSGNFELAIRSCLAIGFQSSETFMRKTFMRKQTEKREPLPNKKPPQQLISNYEASQVDCPVKCSHTIFRQSPWHRQSDWTETSIFDLQNDATVRRIVTTFVWPET